jgi:hypothetical protein
VARAFLYFVTRYQDNMSSYTNPDAAQAFEPNTYPSVDVPYLQLMLDWHSKDPVSLKEISRNDSGFIFQGNRNPYVDSPQYAFRVWNNTCPGLSALPVDIISFSGKLFANEIKLSWVAENEMNFNYFEVERSINGTAYYSIGQVKASNLRSYTFSDNINNLRGRRVYYRLKNVDKNGGFKYSSVFTLHIPLHNTFNIYPNPASTSIQLQLSKNVTGNVSIEITELSGRVIQNQILSMNGNTARLDISKLSNGTYLLRLRHEGELYKQKLIILR